MISRLLKLLRWVVFLVFLLFLIAQLYHIVDVLTSGLSMTHIQLPNFELLERFGLYSFYDLHDTARKILVFLLVFLMLYVFIYIFLGYNIFTRQDTRLTSYQKRNYHHLQNYMERKRGLHRIQYDKHGQITEKTLEHALETVLKPLYILQNALMRYYHKPRYRFWNLRTQKDHQDYLKQLQEREKELEDERKQTRR